MDSADVGAAACTVKNWGYSFSYKCDDPPAYADWDGNGTTDEIFAIAPNRKIYHSWDAANGWKEMPNGGRADYTIQACWADGRRTITVSVGNGQSQGVRWSSHFNQRWIGWYKSAKCDI
ncbi:hypothetical protein [Streptomyces curacoi]|uniref:Ricin B lectin domain-containing protein n=1 Tax=Streptomyces curacoi TaxID=146536 RepID=A0A124GZV3_9ACTN|nr:hypothetical protein [Streptomyces curacoi]KUM73440.1 hypothetical protein AQI70_21995 [Streptomyces curacoi]